MFKKDLVATLRLHSSPITCIETFYLPSSLNFTLKDSQDTKYPLFIPSLITADESGLIIWWNLSTRRPLGIWKAHDETILTVKQLGVEWKISSDGNYIPEINDSFGQLLTHSKDGCIKFWSLIDIVNKSILDFRYTGLLKKKLTDDISNVLPPILYDMPVNTLNFTNIDINSKGYMITPATTDSEGFDVYRINLKESAEHLKLKRLIQNHKLKSTASSKIEEVVDDLDTDPNIDLTKRGGSGVIMKIQWIDEERFAVGYESGKVVLYQLNQEQEEFSIIELMNDDTLLGNPITSICYDMTNNKLLWTSTGSKVCVLNLDERIPGVFELKHKGVSDVQADGFTRSVSVVTWDGYTRFYEYCEDDILKFVSKTRRRAPAISNSSEAVDLGTTDANHANIMDLQRATMTRFSIKQVDPAQNKDINVVYTNGRCKNVVKRNREDVYGERWMFVGYHDGKVSINSIV